MTETEHYAAITDRHYRIRHQYHRLFYPKKDGSDDRVVVLSLRQPSPSRNQLMRDRLTLKSTHQPDQAADTDDKPSRATGRRQPQELQTAFLTDMLDRMVTVYLVNGIRLTGKVKQHDQFTLQLQDVDGIDSLIFKHAISTIIPGAPVVTRERRTPFGKRSEWIG